MKSIIENIWHAIVGDSLQVLRENLSHYNYRRGLELMDTDEQEAYQELQKEVEQYKENGYAHYYMGMILFNQAEYDQARAAINLAIQYLKRDGEWLSLAYVLRARINEEVDDEDAASMDYDTALRINPDCKSAYEHRGVFHHRKKNYALSDADFKRYTELDPGNPYGFACLGRNALEQDNVYEAIFHFEYCIALSPQYDPVYPFRAECRLKQGDIAGCIDDCLYALSLDGMNRKAVDILHYDVPDEFFPLLNVKVKAQKLRDPNNSFWPYLLGWMYRSREQYYDSIRELLEAQRIDSKPIYLDWIAMDYMDLGDYRRAEVYARRALDGREDDYGLHQMLGDILTHQLRYEEAYQEYEICHKLQPDNIRSLEALSEVTRLLGRAEDAKKYAEDAITLDPTSSRSWMRLAQACAKAGDQMGQHKALQEVVTLPDAERNDRIFALTLLGDHEKALLENTDNWTLQGNKDYAVFCLNKAWIYAQVGEVEDAKQALVDSLNNGMRKFDFLLNHDSLQCLYCIPDLEEYVRPFRLQAMYEYLQENKNLYAEGEDEGSDRIVSIPFIQENGQCKVKTLVNGLPLDAVIDPSSTVATISTVEASFMMKNGYLEERDFGGKTGYLTRTGEIEDGTVINLREIKIGDQIWYDVRVLVVSNQESPLLFGQPILRRYAKVEIDKASKVVRLIQEIRMLEPTEYQGAAEYLFASGEYKDAAYLYRQAFDVTHDTENLSMEAFCWNCYGDEQKYSEVVDEALSIIPDNPEINYQKGYSYFFKGQYEEAVITYYDNVRRFPDSKDNWYMLAYILIRLDRNAEAVGVLDQAIGIFPEFYQLHYCRGLALQRMGREEEALPELELCAAKPYDPNYGLVNAESLLRLGRYDECRECIERSLREAEEYAPVYLSMAQLDAAQYYADMGDQESAKGLLEKVLDGPTRSMYRQIRCQFDFESLRSLPGFEETMQSHEALLAADLAELRP